MERPQTCQMPPPRQGDRQGLWAGDSWDAVLAEVDSWSCARTMVQERSRGVFLSVFQKGTVWQGCGIRGAKGAAGKAALENCFRHQELESARHLLKANIFLVQETVSTRGLVLVLPGF